MGNGNSDTSMDERNIVYAGFWTRFLAFVIDMFVLYLPLLAIVENNLPLLAQFSLVPILIFWLYFAVSIAKWRTTIGGKLLGIEISSDDGDNLSFLKASIRVIISLLPFVLYRLVREMQYTMSPPPSPAVQMLPQLIFILAPFVMYASQKRKMLHDMAAKSIVIATRKKISEATSSSKYLSGAQQIVKFVLTLIIVLFGAYILIYTGVFFTLAQGKHEAYNQSFHMKYHTDDYNDTRIQFYQKELDRYSREFIEAEGMYDIFAADTKRDLALNCIEAALKDHNVSDWIDMGSNFRKNARNKYADTEARIKKAKANEDWMGRHFYDYDTNDVNHIEEKIANIWEPKKNVKTCDALMPIEEMYGAFIDQYIPNRFEALATSCGEYVAFPYEYVDKPFDNCGNKQTKQWLNLLQKKHPGVLQRWKQQQRDVAKKRKEKEKQKKAQERYALQQFIFSALSSDKSLPYIPSGMDISRMQNDQGENPLMFAIKKRLTSYFTFDTLAEHTHDFSIEDKSGKTVRDYLSTARDGGWKYADKVFLCLLGYEAKKLGGDIPSWSINNSHVAFDLVHLSCDKLHYPKSYECRDIDKIRSKEPPIFTAMRQGDHTKLRKLLEHGANPNERNPFGTHSLFSAIGYRDAEAVKLLLDHGADMYAMDENGLYSAWTRAVDAGDRNLKIIQLFLDHGVDVNFQHDKSTTALMVAARGCKNFKTVSLLMQHGADPDIEDAYGSTTRKGLSRYCRDKKALKKMLELME